MELSLGKTPDITSYRNITLPQLVEKLPAGFYITGDPAYIPTEHMLTPYSGSQRNDEANDIFNFYLSQLRIRIEMAFGLLTTKWRIFRRPLEGTLENQAKIIETCARLHNFVITEDTEDTFDGIQVCHIDPLPTHDEEGRGYWPIVPEDPSLMTIQGHSFLRESIRSHIINNGFERPQHNIVRKVGA
jgi:hypothetical protein